MKSAFLPTAMLPISWSRRYCQAGSIVIARNAVSTSIACIGPRTVPAAVWRVTAVASRLSHVCYVTPIGIDVFDVWVDEDSFAAFGAIIGPAIVEAGLDAPPSIYPVQGFMGNDGLRNP